MNARSRRVPPVVVAALVNIVLLLMGIAMGIAGLQATPALAAKAPAAAPAHTASRNDDPPPLTPVLDPAPEEPRPVEQIVASPAVAPRAGTPMALLASATDGAICSGGTEGSGCPPTLPAAPH